MDAEIRRSRFPALQKLAENWLNYWRKDGSSRSRQFRQSNFGSLRLRPYHNGGEKPNGHFGAARESWMKSVVSKKFAVTGQHIGTSEYFHVTNPTLQKSPGGAPSVCQYSTMMSTA
jgi:hypothetical protein